MDIATGILLAFVGIGMIGFWTMHIMKGGLTDGIQTLENGGYIGFHITIELVTGGMCLVSGIGLLTAAGWAGVVALLTSGMLLYTSINSLAWSEIRNKPVLSIMFIVPAIISVISIVYLLGMLL